jgi:TRAP-type C4-dicarboxylate transport system substrate-binding protein
VRTLVVSAVAAALVVAATACGGAGADKSGGRSDGRPVVLTLAEHDADYGGPEFASLVEARSHGQIRIRVRDWWRKDRVDFEGRTVADVRDGTVQLGIVGARVWDTLGVRAFQALLAPFLVDSLDLEERVLEGPIGARMLSGVTSSGVVGIATLPGPLARPFGYARPLVGRADYVGARLGLRPGRVEEATFRSLGANTRTYLSLSRASREGAALNLWVIPPAYRGKTLVSNLVFWPRPMTIVMNRRAFEALTPSQRQLLFDAGREAVERRPAEVDRREQDALAMICQDAFASLVRLPEEDVAALHAAVRPVYGELSRDPTTRKLIGEIRALRASGGTSVDSIACPLAAATSAPELEGVWRSSVSRAELLAAGASPAEATTYRGSASLSLKHGHWIFRGEHTTVTGGYRIRGDVVRLTMTTCTANPCSPGAESEYTWSVYRDRLTLSARPGQTSWPRLVVSSSVRVDRP